MTFIGNKDPWMEHAKQIILADDSVSVSLEAKNKDLLKFGRNPLVGTSAATLMHLPAGMLHETYVSTNIITSIISDSASDGETVTVEGHTISGSNLTFVTQQATLNGTTVVTLGTALARCTRVFNNDATDLAGNVYVTQDDTYSSGVPDTDATVHLIVPAGNNNSDKCATALSSVDYWVVTSFQADMLEKSAAFAEVHLEIRLVGKVFREIVDVSVTDAHRGVHDFFPYLIVPPNSDIRLTAIANGASTDISGSIEGSLLKA